jgi:hypothetical protein
MNMKDGRNQERPFAVKKQRSQAIYPGRAVSDEQFPVSFANPPAYSEGWSDVPA